MDTLLRAVATTIGRLSAETPRAARIVYEAMNTPSVSVPGKNMYGGLRTDDYISVADARALLGNHGIGTEQTTFGVDESVAALRALSDALATPTKAAIVTVGDRHAVATALDIATQTMSLDDSDWSVVDEVSGGPCTAMREVPLDDFVTSWSSSGFELLVAELVDVASPAQATWSMLRPRRESARQRRLPE